MDFVGVESCGKGTSRAHEIVRSKIARFTGDRAPIFHDEIAKVSELVCDGILLSGVEELMGSLD
jgi:histidine ammonia-lyase